MSTTTKWTDIKSAKGAEKYAAEIEAVKSAMRDAVALAELRTARGKTQVDVAEQLGISQGNVSQLERRTDVYLSSLEAFVESLGGKLRLVASFPDGDSYPLRLGRHGMATVYKAAEHTVHGKSQPTHVLRGKSIVKAASDVHVHRVGQVAASAASKRVANPKSR